MQHRNGDIFKPSASIQNRLEDLLEDTGATRPIRDALRARCVVVRAKNTGADLERHRIATVQDAVIDPHVAKQGFTDPTISVQPSVWPDAFGAIAITLEPIAASKFGYVALSGVCPCMIDIVKLTDTHAAPDPVNPSQLRSSDTGEVVLIGTPAATGQRLFNVRFGTIGTVQWNYERTADYPNKAVKLVRLDGDDFSPTADTVTLEDQWALMDDQSANDNGICLQTGNKFYANQGPC